MDDRLSAILRRERRIKTVSVLVILASTAIIVFAVDFMLVSFVMAFVVNYLLSPIVNSLERRGLPRQTAIMIPFLSTGVLIGLGIYNLLPVASTQFTLLESQLPKYQVDLANLVSAAEERFKGFSKLYNFSFSQTVNSWVIAQTSALSSSLPQFISGSMTVLILTPFLAYFMLQDGRRISRTVLSMVPNNLFELALNLHHQLNAQMGGFIRARFLEAAIVGLVVWIGLQIADFPYAILLGVFAAVTNLIPYLGPLIGAVPAILIALISEDAMVTPSISINLFIVTAIYLFAQLIDVALIIPFVVARIVNLHPVTVIIVIIIGSQVMGVLGMMISIPVASAIKLVFQTFYRHLTELRS
ncbi:MAG: AI-2E family transporter [Bdellovibrionota bacterium]